MRAPYPDSSCPLPPMENWLKVPIRAGEMTFQDHTPGSGHSHQLPRESGLENPEVAALGAPIVVAPEKVEKSLGRVTGLDDQHCGRMRFEVAEQCDLG
jgi:Protein of unknown function (DUF1684)